MRNKNGEIVFDENYPSPDSESSDEEINDNIANWKHAKKLMLAMWKAAPGGEIRTGYYGNYKSASLIDFKDFWNWGVTNANLPELK